MADSVTQSNTSFTSILTSIKSDVGNWINNLSNNTPALEGQDRVSTQGGITQQTTGLALSSTSATTAKPTTDQFLEGLKSLAVQIIRQSPFGQQAEEAAVNVAKEQAAYQTGVAVGNFVSSPLFIIACVLGGLFLLKRVV